MTPEHRRALLDLSEHCQGQVHAYQTRMDALAAIDANDPAIAKNAHDRDRWEEWHEAVTAVAQEAG